MDDDRRDERNRPADSGYTYRPALPEGAGQGTPGATPDEPFTWPTERDTPGTPPPAPRFVPAAAGAAGPIWEWHGTPQPATNEPSTWPSATVGDRGRNPTPQTGGWRGTAVGRWLARVWPLLLLGLSKLKWLGLIFKLKAFTTFGSMLLSLGAYAVFFGWRFALGFIALLFIHELGHAAVMRAQGIRTTPIVFLPFMGAVIGMREMPKNAFAEAQMALGGPLLGTLGALGALGLWQVTGAPIFVALAYSGFLLNLFNLLPVSPLDGGRAMAAISRWGWLVGLALLVALFLRVHSLMLGIILIFGATEVFRRWQNRDADRAYYETTGRQRLLIAAVYFGLAAFLALAMFAAQSHLLTNRPV